MSKKKGTKHSTMSNEDFVVLWQQSPDIESVRAGYDLEGVSAQARATRLRKHGVDLKKFHRGNTVQIDVEGLNKLAKKTIAKA